VEHIRKRELDQLAQATGAEVVILKGGKGEKEQEKQARQWRPGGVAFLAQTDHLSNDARRHIFLFVDDGADMFSFQSIEDMLRMVQSIDDLELLEAFGPLQQGKNRLSMMRSSRSNSRSSLPKSDHRT